MKFAKCTSIDGWDNMIEFFKSNDIETKPINIDKQGFYRDVEFTINNIMYVVNWFKNVSYLKIGNDRRNSFIQFTEINLNETWPLLDKNEALLFTNKENYDSGFYVPTELKGENK